MTLNLAHGRKNRPNRVYRKRHSVQSNLIHIARVLKREQPDLVALQEADGPSFWSGNFNHVAYLAKHAGYSHFIQGEHMSRMRLSYGTALLSHLPLKNLASVKFRPSPPTFSKGFVTSTVSWPGEPSREINVVSLHFDFSRKSIRRRQAEATAAQLSCQSGPMIVMGDFNCTWRARKSALRGLMEQLDLVAYQPNDSGLITFPLSRKRLDWILISRDLHFHSYKVLTDVLSDHRAVISEVKFPDAPGSFLKV